MYINRYRFNILLIVVSISVFLFIIYNNFYKIELLPRESLSLEIHRLVEEEKYIDFRKIDSFEWDRMVIIRPYGEVAKTLKVENIHNKKIKKNIETQDDINMIIFVNKNEIVQYVNLGRNIDFNLNKSISYLKNDVMFKIDRKNNYVMLVHK